MIKRLLAKIAGKLLKRKLKLEDKPMSDTKKWWKSKSVITGIVTVLIGLYEGVKLQVAPQFGWSMPEIPGLLLTLLGALGIYSRVVADKKIG